MVLLGAVTADDKFPLTKESVIDAMKNNLKPKFHEMNLKAIENGYNAIKDKLLYPSAKLFSLLLKTLTKIFSKLLEKVWLK